MVNPGLHGGSDVLHGGSDVLHGFPLVHKAEITQAHPEAQPSREEPVDVALKDLHSGYCIHHQWPQWQATTLIYPFPELHGQNQPSLLLRARCLVPTGVTRLLCYHRVTS